MTGPFGQTTILVHGRRTPVVVCAVLALLLLALLAPRYSWDSDFPRTRDGLLQAGALLSGEAPRADVATDMAGARALVEDRPAYEPLAEGLTDLGLDWPVRHPSTHPPTSYVLTLPFAGFQWPVSSVLWSWLMLGVFAASMRLLGMRWRWAAPAAVLMLLWPPAAWSLGQTTPLWLFGQSLAEAARSRPRWAGVGIGLAAAVKIVPGLLLAPFLIARRWGALAGCVATAGGLLGLAVLISPRVLTDWYAVTTATGKVVSRSDNGALLHVAGDALGPTGPVLVALAVAGVVVCCRGGWDAWVWAAVALLPIAWVYSLLPLLPVLFRLVLRGGLIPRVAATIALLLPMLTSPFGSDAAAMVLMTVVATGGALLLHALLALRNAEAAPQSGTGEGAQDRGAVVSVGR